MNEKWNAAARGIAIAAAGALMLGGNAIGVSADDSDNDTGEVAVAAGTLDDGQDLQSLAGISIADAVAAARGAATGPVGEVDLEYVGDLLVYNVDVGKHDVKVDAGDGAIVAVDTDD